MGIRSGHLALKSRSYHIQMLAVSVGEALLFTLMVNQLWEAGRRKSDRSSTFRELRAIRYVLESYSSDFRGKEVCHRTDNRNAEIIMSVGSRVPDLHREAVLVSKICCELNIRLSVEWPVEMIIVLLMSFQEWRMLLTTCWILSAFAILIGYGDFIPSTDLPALKPNSWSGIAVDTATLVVRLVMRLRFPGHRITIGFFHLPCLFRRF